MRLPLGKALLLLGLLWCKPLLAATCDHVTLPLTFDAQGRPYIEVEVAGHDYQARIEVGSRIGLSMAQEVLLKVHATKFSGKDVRITDLDDNQRNPWDYQVSHFQIGCMRFSNISGAELPPQSRQPGQDKIVLGRDMFKGRQLELSYLFSAVTIREVSKHGATDRFEPMTLDPYFGIMISARTLAKNYRLALTNGTSHTLLDKAKVPKTEQVKPSIYSTDQGPLSELDRPLLVGHKAFSSHILLYPIKGPNREDSDGVLGNDFFKQYDVDIDFKNKLIRLIKT